MPASERSSIWKTTVYSVLLILAIWPLCHGRQVYHVTPNEETNCHNATVPCHTLDYYAKELHSDPFYFQQQTVLYFHPGIHTLEGNNSMDFKAMEGLVLLGSDEISSSGSVPSESTEILCKSEAAAGFIFLRVNNLVIANLTITSCGLMYRNTSAAIRIGFVTNLTISHTVVQNSTGYGVRAVIDEPGNIVVTNSAFINNGRDADQRGGHTIFAILGNSLVNCSAAGGSSGGINLSIRSSMFLHGNTLGINPLGLVIYLVYPCYLFKIHITNSTFTGNREYQKGGGEGGHLFLSVLYSRLSKVHGSTIVIANSQFINGTAHFTGGAATVRIEEVSAYPCNESAYPSQIHFAVFNTLFYGNKALVCGGLQISAKEACHGHHTFEFNNVTFSNNSANNEAHTMIQNQVTAMHPHGIKIRNCTFANGESTLGSSLAIHVDRVDPTGAEICINNAYSTSTLTCVEICHSKFTNNKGVLGGGVYIYMERYTTRSPCRIDICNSSFTSNAAPALLLSVGNYISSAELYLFRFTNLDFHDNYSPKAQSPHHTNASIQDPFQLYTDYFQTLASITDTEMSSSLASPGVIRLSDVKSATFINCKVNDNKSTGLVASHSNLIFEGRSTFRGNLVKGIGGGMVLRGSYILINSKLQLHFINNHATFGAAIYISFMPNDLDCFFQPNTHPGTPVQAIGGMIQFENNSATIAGDVLYRGNVDKCSISEVSDPKTDEGAQAYIAHFNANYYGSELFNLTFNYSSQRGLSVISSDPVAICLCKNGEPRCVLRSMPIKAYPGEPFTVSAVGVGQRNGVTPTIVRAYHQKMFSSILLEETHPQKLSLQCSLLKYFVSSQHSFEKIFLYPDTQNTWPIIEYSTLEVSLLPCPLGFNLSTATERCECAPPLDELNFNCSIASQTIHRPSAVWIGYYYFNSDDESSNNTVTPGGVILYMHCPLDYCKTEDTELNLEDPSEQCAFNHSGILCGACQPGLSLALGTSRCLPCSNAYVALVFAFAVAGVALVALLTVCNLTVSQGTLGGLIFYANIIHINHPVFFPGDDVNVLTVFIAWLNLDLGIETCFHQGMSMYEKAWLQFIFPTYVLLVSLVIMILSHYSTIATRIFGRHAVKVLATLFLLAYAKLLRSIITVLSYTSMIYPDHSLRFLWLYDGSIMYFHDKHIPLGLAAVIAFLLVIVPYTLTLIFGQCLQRGGCYRMVNRLKPFLDAYNGPYKDKYRFWPGILLLARVILFLIFAFNVQGAPALNLLSIGVISSLLFGTVLYCEVYKSNLHNLLESFFMLNTICLSIAMLYIQAVGGSQTAVSYTSAGATFAAFIAIVIYHSLKSISTSRLWRTVSGHVRKARQLPTELAHLPRPQASPDNSDSSSDEEPLDVGHDRVQRLRLTFDSNDDAVLVVDKD